MAYILVDLQGKATNGGWLSYDGGGSYKLTDGRLISIEPGTHYLDFRAESPEQRRSVSGIAKVALLGSDDSNGQLVMEFSNNSVLKLTIISDANGKILSKPSWVMLEADDEQMASFHSEYYAQNERRNTQIAEEKIRTLEKAKKAFWLCLGLGWAGAHKFYRHKYFMGIVYFLTVGLFGYGWIYDCISLGIDWRNAKRNIT